MGTQADSSDKDYGRNNTLPCIMWLCIYKPKKFGLSWWANWICITFGVCLMVLAPIGGLRQIIIEAKDYEFFS